MCWEGWNPDWDSEEWFQRVVDARTTGKKHTQEQVWRQIREDHEKRRKNGTQD